MGCLRWVGASEQKSRHSVGLPSIRKEEPSCYRAQPERGSSHPCLPCRSVGVAIHYRSSLLSAGY
uniref:Uncharacterized protein n=1 Tax=Picea glauca TaxID=3330 RepID=A0A124GNH8_PICGL|nr:hypothetical protein ABT39_MTgene4212 [Picea glauca]QHR87046.1 hypothetical protein Q903MT_gene1055 [Picea sitchensis]